MISGKQCYLGAIACMESWLSMVICPCDVEVLPQEDVLNELWVRLGCDVDTVEVLVRMRVFYNVTENKLWILRGALQNDSFMNELSTALLNCWKLDAFTESRWLTLGKSGRSYVRAHMLGFGSVVQHGKDQGTITNYQVAGYERATSRVSLLLALLSIVANVPETLLAMLFKDNRLGRYGETAVEALASELACIAEAPSFVWEAIARIVDVDREKFKAMVIRASHRSYAFIMEKVLNKACNVPWSLTYGSITQKL
eukprot:6479582-Amphidinium_carterae.1